MEQIRALLLAGHKSRNWLRIEKYHLNAYIRVTDRYLGGFIVPTLDIATVDVDKEHQHQSNFTAFLTECEALAKEFMRTIYIETIVNGTLFEFLKRRGYEVKTSDFRSLCKTFH